MTLARSLSATLLICLTAIPPWGTPRAEAITPAEMVARLSAQREAHGIPGGLIEDPEMSAGCDDHIRYMQQNGGSLTHGENPSSPGYTVEGALAGSRSVLSRGGSWDYRNPWETAPIHLHQLLAPRLLVTGAAERDTYVCMNTLSGRTRAPAVAWTTYTYPGDGAVGHRFSELAFERPYTPGEKLGIPAGATTGPYLYVSFDGPAQRITGATATSWSLIGPDGPVDVAVADNQTQGLEGYLPPGMELIPRQPLRPKARYTATVSADVSYEDSGTKVQPLSHQWSFVTAGRPNAVSVALAGGDPRRVTITSVSDAPIAEVQVTDPTGRAFGVRLTNGSATVERTAAGTWKVCGSSGGDGTEFESAQACAEASFDLPPRRSELRLVSLSRRRLTIAVPDSAVGRVARVTFIRWRRVCAHRCVRRQAGRTTRSAKLRPPLTRVTVPSIKGSSLKRSSTVEVRVAVPAFRVGEVQYLSTLLIRRLGSG